MKPKILLSAKSNKQYYIEAVNMCGGIADVQYCPVVSTDYDGLILCGGNDIGPKHYGEEFAGAVDIDEKRDKSELALIDAFVRAGKPVMGICRGMQLVNVYFGGSLVQNLENADFHANRTDKYLVHEVSAECGSLAHRLHGDSFSVNSSHHQAVKRLGDGLIATAYSGDVVEAVEHTGYPVIGVQWHPERMCFSQKRADAVDGAKIFEHFLKLCESKAL